MKHLILVLYRLCREFKPGEDTLYLSTSDAGELWDVSQQTASRYLNELETKGFIVKTRSGGKQRIELTGEGRENLLDMYLVLKHYFEHDDVTVYDGVVVAGLGEGAYYVEQYEKRVLDKLGIKPFHGTLNVRLKEGRASIIRYAAGSIEGFESNGRVYGRLDYLPVKLSADDLSIRCFLVLPQRTHHRDEVEIISEKNLRKEYGLKDGDVVRIEVVR